MNSYRAKPFASGQGRKNTLDKNNPVYSMCPWEYPGFLKENVMYAEDTAMDLPYILHGCCLTLLWCLSSVSWCVVVDLLTYRVLCTDDSVQISTKEDMMGINWALLWLDGDSTVSGHHTSTRWWVGGNSYPHSPQLKDIIRIHFFHSWSEIWGGGNVVKSANLFVMSIPGHHNKEADVIYVVLWLTF